MVVRALRVGVRYEEEVLPERIVAPSGSTAVWPSERSHHVELQRLPRDVGGAQRWVMLVDGE